MSPQPQGTVQVYAVGFYVKILYALFEQHGKMFGFVAQNSSSSITAAMFSGVVSIW